MVTKNIRIPFHLCDPARMMFFGSFFEIYHMFLEENLPHLGIDWDTWFMGTTGAPVRAANVQYDAPLKFGTEYSASLGVKKLGNSSVVFRFSVGDKNKEHAFTEVTHSFVDFTKKEKAEIPKGIKLLLLKHLIDQ